MSGADYVRMTWRTGRSIGRTIYAVPKGARYRQGEVVLGMVDTPELAAHIVKIHNVWLYDGDGGWQCADSCDHAAGAYYCERTAP